MGEFRYDQSDIHLCYEKSRQLPAEAIRLWLETISRYVPRDSTQAILDLGCGTGRFTEALSHHFSAQVLGIDPSLKMLMIAKQAISSPLIRFIQGVAESIPLADGEVDMVFLSMVYHHIRDKEKAIGEFVRVLKKGGFLCIRTATADSIDSYLWVQFFPGARQIEVGRMPSREGLTTFLRTSGFESVGHIIVRQLCAKNFQGYFEKIALRGISSLKAIPDDEFREGLVRFEKYCRENGPGESVFEDIELFVLCVA